MKAQICLMIIVLIKKYAYFAYGYIHEYIIGLKSRNTTRLIKRHKQHYSHSARIMHGERVPLIIGTELDSESNSDIATRSN